SPPLWQEFRVQLLERLEEPGAWKSLGYQNQVNIGLMIGVPLHSTMSTQFIAQQQHMFTQRQQLQPMKPQLGAPQGSSSAGRPQESREATQAQRITEH